MRSLRSPVPTWVRRRSAYSPACCSRCMSYSRDFSTRMAFSRFWIWLRWSCEVTTSPVGMWVMRTAESVRLMCWPPAPEAR